MPSYEYECNVCAYRFEASQGINDEPLTECPQCKGALRRLISASGGIIVKGSGAAGSSASGCSFQDTGQTCCGLGEPCESSPCGD